MASSWKQNLLALLAWTRSVKQLLGKDVGDSHADCLLLAAITGTIKEWRTADELPLPSFQSDTLNDLTKEDKKCIWVRRHEKTAFLMELCVSFWEAREIALQMRKSP